MLLESLTANLQAEGLLQAAPNAHVVLGFSGGADSTALLYLLADLKKQFPLKVTAAYYHHAWRGKTPEELPLLHKHCLRTQTPLVIIPADLNTPQTEHSAREARYRQLTGLACDLKAQALLTAHHADDQIETLLFRIFRGTGADGLVGIQKHLVLNAAAGSPVPIVRPLLDVQRQVLRAYLYEQNIAYFHDPTNDSTKYHRNLIRKEILPSLEQSFPQVKNSLLRLSMVAAGDVHILEESTQTIWERLYGLDEQGPYLDAVRFNQLGVPHQRRLLKRFLNQYDLYPDFHTIEACLAFIQGEGRKSMDSALKSLPQAETGGQRFLSLYKDRLRILVKPIQEAAWEAIPVQMPGVTRMPALNKTFRALPWEEAENVGMSPIRANDTQQVFVNLAAFADKLLELRRRRPGDKFKPMGMSEPIRLKKFLINRGIPRFERDQLLLLAHGNHILWVPGLGISQDLALKPNSKPTHLFKLVSGLQAEEPSAPSPDETPPEQTSEPVAEGASPL